ncbi:MAG: ComEC/Rec2 family competence protein [Candidatus Scalindua sp.]
MAWDLQIYHIDVIGSGDATLVVAENDTTGQKRTMLIDGGRLGYGRNLHLAVQDYLEGSNLDVIVATHYDSDHIGGIQFLLNTGHASYANTRIYDQGEQATVYSVWVRNSPGTMPAGRHEARFLLFQRENDYTNYLRAVDGRVRITATVSSSDTLDPLSLLVTQLNWRQPNWLLGREILWDGTGGIPPGAPTVQCLAVNQYVRNAAGVSNLRRNGLLTTADRLKNEKSIALKITFNNFRYYVGGDIESTQEDGSFNHANINQNNGIADNLNHNNNLGGRIQAFKTSHHGSDISTSNYFLNRVRPRVAFISCGVNNQYNHPRQRVVNSLQASTCVHYFLTGPSYQGGGAVLTQKARVAGVWRLNQNGTRTLVEEGDIVLTLSQTQSNNIPPQFGINYYQTDNGGMPDNPGPPPHSFRVENY